MILRIFTVYDAAVNAFMTPFFARSKGEAIRSFTQAVNDEKSQFNANPSDYGLWYLGDFDDDSGSVTPPNAPEKVIQAIEVLGDKKLPGF